MQRRYRRAGWNEVLETLLYEVAPKEEQGVLLAE